MKVKTLEESEDYYPKVKSTSVSRKQTDAGVCWINLIWSAKRRIN